MFNICLLLSLSHSIAIRGDSSDLLRLSEPIRHRFPLCIVASPNSSIFLTCLCKVESDNPVLDARLRYVKL